MEGTCEERSRRPRGRRGKEVRVSRTSVGKGVFAGRNYRKGDIIGEIEGQVIDDADYGSDYCMNIGGGQALEPAAPFRFVNHSCAPNCRFDYFDLSTERGEVPLRRTFLLALCEIRPGDELTIDYGWSARGAIPCRCGEPNCRGWIVSQEELPKLLSARQAALHENP